MYGATFICGGGGEHEIPRNFVSFYFDLFDALLVPRPGCQGRESHRNWSNEFIFQTNVSINLHRGEKSENIFILFHRVNKKRNSKTSRITQTSALSSHLMPPHRRVIIWIISRKNYLKKGTSFPVKFCTRES